jgi:crotonobetainyl-CoA:carnitine CoA-transferase CaiB-like acyl-CoA transferase
MAETERKPLDGITVLDLTAGLAGPYATLLLAGLGARVIKIERPISAEGEFLGRDSMPYIGRDGLSATKEHEDDVGWGGLVRLRDKQCISLDMKHPDSRPVLHDLIAQSDVLLENLSRGTAARIGAGYEDAKAIRPDIIYCSISGAGQDDTSGSGKTIDTVVQAMSGLMTLSGLPDDPPLRHGVPLADLVTPLYAVIGVLSALNQRNTTGEGQHVDVSMLGAITTLIANEPFDALEDLGIPKRTGPTVPRMAPLGVYPAADGWVSICTVSDARFKSLCQVMERPDLLTDPRFAKRQQRIGNHQAIDAEVAKWTRTLPATTVAERLDAVGIPSGEVRSTREALRDPRVHIHGDVVKLEHGKYGATHEIYGPGVPIKFSKASNRMSGVVTEYAQHNQAVYGDLLGYSADRMAELKAKGVI